MVIPNMVMKFHNFDIFYQICYIFDLSSALACRVESIKDFGSVWQGWNWTRYRFWKREMALELCIVQAYVADR